MRKSLPVFIFALMFSVTPGIAQKDKPEPVKPDSASLKDAFAFMEAQQHIPKAPQTIQSPNAASLGAHGEIPISLYTGKPGININLHSVSEGDVKIPISLDYDASGVRPDQHTGWVGLNFNLSTNYSITRTISDGPDDCPYFDSRGQRGHLFDRSLIYAANWNTTTGIKSIADSYLGRYDSEPDQFNFNLPGLSGKFFIGQSGFKVVCDRPVTVEIIGGTPTTYPPFSPIHGDFGPSLWLTNGNYLEHLAGFTITDEFGTKYEFGGGNTDYMEYSMAFFDQQQDTWVCNAWYLKSIKTRHTGQEVNFTYERGALVAQMYFSVFNKTARVNGGGWFNCLNWSSYVDDFGPYNGKLISPVYLKEITGSNFKVKFTSTPSTELPYSEDIFSTFVNRKILNETGKIYFLTYLYDCFYPVFTGSNTCNTSTTLTDLIAKLKWRKLDKIEIQNKAGTATIRQFEFSYNNVATERLMLLSVQEKSGDGTKQIPPYEFAYFSDPGLSLPGYCKSHTDHWGYNNGAPINVASDFNDANAPVYGINFRSPNPDARYLKLGSLLSIKYPTGSVTKLIMEPHTYSKEVMLKRWDGEDPFTTNQRAGGLRVKEIHTYDNATSNVVSKKYYYLSTFNPVSPDTATTVLSSGVLGGKAQYYFPMYQPLAQDPSVTIEEEIFSTQSIMPASENSMGSHIGYSQVIERSSATGWTVYKFSNFENGYRDDAPSGFLQPSNTPYQPYNSNAFKRGKELSVEHYYQNGNISSKTTTQYGLVGDLATYSSRSVKTTFEGLCQTDNRAYEGTAAIIDARKFLPVEQITQLYDQDNSAAFTTQTVTKTYWPNGQLYINGQTDSRGRTLKTWYKYPPNLAAAPGPAMTLANIIATPFEVFQYTGTEAAPSAIKLQTVTFNSTAPYLPSKVESKLGPGGGY